jgi:CO/xanthine dehydrogenase FAD-binding subunit
MLLPKFNYHQPATLSHAFQIMAECGESACILAGGTDVLVNMKKGITVPNHLVSLPQIPELRGLDLQENKLVIGPCQTVAEIADSPEITSRFNALALGAMNLGSPLVRNLATIGGNIVSARPAADLLPPLIVHGASVTLRSLDSRRNILLEDFLKGPGRTDRNPEEILCEIVLEAPPSCSGSHYIKLGHRKAMDISIVNVAAFIEMDHQRRLIRSSRLSLGAVGPTPIRALSAEEMLRGEKPSEDLLKRAARAAARESTPIDDFRGSADYRRLMIEELTRRALNGALAKALS